MGYGWSRFGRELLHGAVLAYAITVTTPQFIIAKDMIVEPTILAVDLETRIEPDDPLAMLNQATRAVHVQNEDTAYWCNDYVFATADLLRTLDPQDRASFRIAGGYMATNASYEPHTWIEFKDDGVWTAYEPNIERTDASGPRDNLIEAERVPTFYRNLASPFVRPNPTVRILHPRFGLHEILLNGTYRR